MSRLLGYHRNDFNKSITLAILAFFTNFVLTHLVVYHSPKTLGTYKYLMICICLFEIVYELLDLAASPDMYTKGSKFLVIVNSKKTPFPISTLQWINLAYCTFFGTSLAIFSTHFVFRYLVVIGHKNWIVPSARNISFWLLVPLVFGACWMLTAWVFISPTEYLNSILRDEIKIYYGDRIENIAYVGVVFYPTERNVNWLAIQGFILFVIMISASFSTMLIFGFKSYFALNSAIMQSSRSSQFKNLQSQLLYSLVLQTIIPLTLMHFPSGICFVIPIFGISREMFGRVLTVTISIYPVLDPLPNMFLIKDYRRQLKKRLNMIGFIKTSS